MMKQAQKMQEDMQKAQQQLANEEVTGESGGGMVKVTMNGKHEVRRIEIDDTLVGDDKEFRFSLRGFLLMSSAIRSQAVFMLFL